MAHNARVRLLVLPETKDDDFILDFVTIEA